MVRKKVLMYYKLINSFDQGVHSFGFFLPNSWKNENPNSRVYFLANADFRLLIFRISADN
jgi:hypothetical protein